MTKVRVLILVGGSAAIDREFVVKDTSGSAVTETVRHQPIRMLPIASGGESRLRDALDDLEKKFLNRRAS